MNWFSDLFFGSESLWGGGVAHSVLILALVIAVGVALNRIRIAGISLGVTWILFAGIAFSHFGMHLNEDLMHFVKEFGLILFVFSIGLQVGPGFFSSFKKGGIQLNLMSMFIVLLGVAVTLAIYALTDMPISTMVGIMSGAVTNTPGLGAAQQASSEILGFNDPGIATGYALAYPLGVMGIIMSMIALRFMFKVDMKLEESNARNADQGSYEQSACRLSLRVENKAFINKSVGEMHDMTTMNYVISRIRRQEGEVEIVNSHTILKMGDDVLVVTSRADAEAITKFVGKEVNVEWAELNTKLISRRIVITKSELNGKSLSQLKLRSGLGVNITRIHRSGVDLLASPGLTLQIGDRVTVVGTDSAISEVEKKLGNSLKRLNTPNLFPIFIGIVLGVILGSVPIFFPGVPQPVKLGLAGGPLIISILISRFGPQYKLVTYTTTSANLMLREVGIALFLACVGLGAGKGFIDTLINQGGYVWVGYGALITIVPLLTVGIIARVAFKMNYFTLIGLMAGSMTDPPALAYANDSAGNDVPAVSYATVYPLTMFLRVLSAQLLILFLM